MVKCMDNQSCQTPFPNTLKSKAKNCFPESHELKEQQGNNFNGHEDNDNHDNVKRRVMQKKNDAIFSCQQVANPMQHLRQITLAISRALSERIGVHGLQHLGSHLD